MKTKSLILAILLSGTIYGYTQEVVIKESRVKKSKCVSGDCENGNGHFEYSNGDHYIGEFKEKKFNGKGEFDYAIGDIFDGNWVDNKKNGSGIYMTSDNSAFGIVEYDGDWKKL